MMLILSLHSLLALGCGDDNNVRYDLDYGSIFPYNGADDLTVVGNFVAGPEESRGQQSQIDIKISFENGKITYSDSVIDAYLEELDRGRQVSYGTVQGTFATDPVSGGIFQNGNFQIRESRAAPIYKNGEPVEGNLILNIEIFGSLDWDPITKHIVGTEIYSRLELFHMRETQVVSNTDITAYVYSSGTYHDALCNVPLADEESNNTPEEAHVVGLINPSDTTIAGCLSNAIYFADPLVGDIDYFEFWVEEEATVTITLIWDAARFPTALGMKLYTKEEPSTSIASVSGEVSFGSMSPRINVSMNPHQSHYISVFGYYGFGGSYTIEFTK